MSVKVVVGGIIEKDGKFYNIKNKEISYNITSNNYSFYKDTSNYKIILCIKKLHFSIKKLLIFLMMIFIRL